MGLKVWLPLNGDLHNQGCSDITVENLGATVNASGKIGKCYAFNGTSTNYLRLPAILNSTDEFSIAFWVKNTATNVNYCYYSQRVEANGTGFSIFYMNGQGIRFDEGTSLQSSQTFAAGTWHHVVCCRDSVKKYIYIDGSLSVSGNKTDTSAAKVNTNYSLIGGSQNNAAGSTPQTNANLFNGSLNDYRIYDHCLSAAEVREISQGLVLHYKLDGFQGGYGNPNLALGSQTLSTTATVSNTYISKRGAATLGTRDGFAQVNGTAAWQGFSLWSNSLNLQVGTTYTYSFYAYTALSTSTNAGISFYPMMYNSAGTRDTTSKLPISVMGGTFTEVNSKQIGVLNTTPKLYWATFTWNQTMANILTNGGKIELSIQIHGTFNEGRIDYLWAPKLEIGNTPTNWSPAASEGSFNIIQDSSGYGHNGSINSNLTLSSITPRYQYSMSFDGVDDCIIVPYNTICPENIFTFNLWFKKDALGSKSYETLFGGPSGFEMDTRAGAATSLSLYMASTRSGNRNAVTSLSLGNWYMITMTRDGTKEKYYVNGIFQSEIDAKSMPNGTYRIGAWASNTGQNYYGLISDFRIYCTALDADAIRQLYEVSAKVDNKGNTHTFEFKEESSNILFPVEVSRTKLEFSNGLGRYTQANCQVTLTENGYRIYRPPNLTTADNGNTMYGGLKLINQSTDTVNPYNATRDNIWGLQKGHTYLLAFHAKGKTTNGISSFGYTNNMGWGIGGVAPTPSTIAKSSIGSNFNGEKDCFFVYKINDDIIKTSNDARGGYDGSSQYLSYRHIAFNWAYANTGADGTDIYLTNFRMYDITDAIGKIKNIGQMDFNGLIEQLDKTQIRKKCELLSAEFIEI